MLFTALASHQCDPGSNAGGDDMRWSSLLLNLAFVDEEPLWDMLPLNLYIFIYLFVCLFMYLFVYYFPTDLYHYHARSEG